MTRTRTVLLLLLIAALAVVLTGCGGGDEDVPKDAIAVVDGQDIPKADFDRLMDQARNSYKLQKRDFPKAGTPEYNQLKNQAVGFLVQRVQFEKEAEEFGVEIGDKEVDKRLKQLIKQYFGGDNDKYEKELKKQGISNEQVRTDVHAQLLQEELFKKVTEEVKVTDADIAKYYKEHKDQYGTPETRDVRHILVNNKQLADQLYDRLKGGESFATLAKKYSKDPGSKDQGGKLTISRGQTVAQFDRTAFLLGKNVLSRPVKTEYGFHLIEPLGETKPAKTTPLKDVKETIKQQLLSTKKNERMTKWVEETREEYKKKTTYQVGFAPPESASTTTDKK